MTVPNITPNESNLEKGVVRIVPKGEHSSIVISILNFYIMSSKFSLCTEDFQCSVDSVVSTKGSVH